MNAMLHKNENAEFNQKYLTKNPISKYLVSNFNSSVRNLVQSIEFSSLVDIGCGEGFMLHYLQDILEGKESHAFDICRSEVAVAKTNLPFCNVDYGSIYEIPLGDEAVDLVICTEVLEHLEEPEKGLAEIARVTRKYALVSVPREPIWRLLNMVRGSYLAEFGNTPGHLNHWSSTSFRRFLSSKFSLLRWKKPLPWTICLLEKT